MKRFFSALPLLWLLSAGWAPAQSPAPYLKAATFYISVDDWADIFLNGIPIIENQPYTNSGKGPQTRVCLPEHLCYFKRENILAIEVSDKAVSVEAGEDSVGIAYVLRMDFSDGRQLILSSNDPADHRCLYVPNRMSGNPRGWPQMTFNDGAWAAAFSSGPSIPYAAALTDPSGHQPVSFLSARANSPAAQFPGERHLFRRKFFLDIGNNPICLTPSAVPKIRPMVVTQPDVRHAVRVPPTTPTPLFFPAPAPAEAPVPGVTPTPPPVRRRASVAPKARVWWTPTSTPTFAWKATADLDPLLLAAPPMLPPKPTSTPTPPLVLTPPAAEAQTIVFGAPPANIYMSFADGPGIYRLELFDGAGVFLGSLFEKRIVAQADGWAVWDGKTGGGREAPPGRYFVIFSKDGKPLKKIFITRTPVSRESDF